MIFRRLALNLKLQNWTAIWIEFVLLVAGVFLGIQVSNWNEDRATNQKAVVFTARLTDDLRKEAWSYEYLIAYNRDTNRNQRRVLDAMAGEKPLSDEQLLVSAYRATQYKDAGQYRATYDELISTGTISLITDRQLRETAIGVFTTPAFDQLTEQVMGSEYRRLFRETVPAAVQESLLSRCGDRFAPVLDYAAIAGSIDFPCTLDVPPGKIQAAANALKALPRFVPALRIRFADNQTALTDLQESNREVLKGLRAIEEAKP